MQQIQCTPAWGRVWGLALHTGGPAVTSVLFLGMEESLLMLMHHSSSAGGGGGVQGSLTAGPVSSSSYVKAWHA